MSGLQIGHYAPGDVRWFLAANSITVPLAEIVEGGISFDVAATIDPGGKGLGDLKNKYWKTVDAAKGTGKISRNLLDRTDGGMYFNDVMVGAKSLIQEPVAASVTTYTTTLLPYSIIEIRDTVNNVVLVRGIDYVVTWSTGAITFTASTPNACVVKYVATSRRNANLIVNGGFEDPLGNIWSAIATATIARNTANAFAEGNALGVTPTASNDGVQYNYSIPVEAGRTYRLMLRAKAAAAETLVGKWNDGTTDQTMSPASVTLTTSYALYQFTFTATKTLIANLKILDSKVSPALFYIDEVSLQDDAGNASPFTAINPMDAGRALYPFTFDLLGQRIVDGVMAYQLLNCAVMKDADKSGKEYMEDVDFGFLDAIVQTQ